MDVVTLTDFLDSGIRLNIGARRTYAQLQHFGLHIPLAEFYSKWHRRRALWESRGQA